MTKRNRYRISECEANDIGGSPVRIPGGVYTAFVSPTETSLTSGGREVLIDTLEFKMLKTSGLAVLANDKGPRFGVPDSRS